jgi:apolipoprotein N-acyltransferase
MSRYDKQFLLSFIEKPLAGVSIPFFSNKGFLVSDDVEHSVPLQTPFGKAGIMICNEAAIEKPARESTKSGAEFFCNMSNDGWFNDTYITRSHFLNARLRAVETRKDVVVNCNNGFSGMIDAAGNIVEQQKDTEPFIKIAEIHPERLSHHGDESSNAFCLSLCRLHFGYCYDEVFSEVERIPINIRYSKS